MVFLSPRPILVYISPTKADKEGRHAYRRHYREFTCDDRVHMSRTVGGRRHADRHAAAPQVPSEPDRRFDWRDAVLPAAGILAVADVSRRRAGGTLELRRAMPGVVSVCRFWSRACAVLV